jgi:hypothetical protein
MRAGPRRKVIEMPHTERLTEEQVGMGEESLRLAAVLAAVLLEYRQQRSETSAGGLAPETGVRWRMLARMEQLQGTV